MGRSRGIGMALVMCLLSMETGCTHLQTAEKKISGDMTAPDLSCEAFEVTEGEEEDILSHCTYQDDVSWSPKAYVYAEDDLSTVGTHQATVTVTDEAGNITVRNTEVTVTPKPTPTPEPEVVPQPEPAQNTGGYVPAPVQQPQQVQPAQPANPQTNYSHGTEYFLFSDGYNMDSSYNACVAAGSAHGGSWQCTPIMGEDGLYKGYTLDY